MFLQFEYKVILEPQVLPASTITYLIAIIVILDLTPYLLK